MLDISSQQYLLVGIQSHATADVLRSDSIWIFSKMYWYCTALQSLGRPKAATLLRFILPLPFEAQLIIKNRRSTVYLCWAIAFLNCSYRLRKQMLINNMELKMHAWRFVDWTDVRHSSSQRLYLIHQSFSTVSLQSLKGLSFMLVEYDIAWMSWSRI